MSNEPHEKTPPPQTQNTEQKKSPATPQQNQTTKQQANKPIRRPGTTNHNKVSSSLKTTPEDSFIYLKYRNTFSFFLETQRLPDFLHIFSVRTVFYRLRSSAMAFYLQLRRQSAFKSVSDSIVNGWRFAAGNRPPNVCIWVHLEGKLQYTGKYT